MDITIFGTGTSGHQFIVNTIEEVMDKANLEVNIKVNTDVQSFIKYHIKSIPAVQINDETPVSVKQNGAFNHSVRSIISDILKRNDYGDYPRYIVPIDFSDTSKNAFYFGHRLATDTDAMVKLLHVYHPGPNDLLQESFEPDEIIVKKEQELDHFAKIVNVDWGSDIMKAALVDHEFKVGFPGEIILDHVKQNHANLLIVGATGKGGILKQLFGSVSMKLMNEASCPVLVVPKAAKYGGIKKILFTCAGENEDEKILTQLIDFGSKFNAEIHFLHISQNQETPFNDVFLKKVQDLLPEHKYKIVNLEDDNIEDSILSYANDNDFDLISMGSKQKTFVDGLLHKSISKQLNLMSKLPLLILR